MSTKTYIHGYDQHEQERLIEQADYWKDRLILKYAKYKANESLLEIGCGDGAVLAILAEAFPSMSLAGIDISEEQISAGKKHLSNWNVDLRVGDANQLPWSDNTFDHIYCSWVLEHMSEHLGVLKEALRVLKPGGKIRIHETDYSTWACLPNSNDFELIRKAWYIYFEKAGRPTIGRELGALLNKAGFEHVKNDGLVMHYYKNNQEDELKQFVDYISNFTKPVANELAILVGASAKEFKKAIDGFDSISNDPMGCISLTVHNATAVKP